jgi:hypothetical protein
MSQRYLAGFITASYNPLLVPNAPTIGTATGGNAQASVTFTAPANIGGSAITSYQVISTPGNVTATGSSSPIVVTGLTNGTAYTFKVVAINSFGVGFASAASNSVTPIVPNLISDVFSTSLYTGNSGTQTITNGINISGNGGLTWIKPRTAVGAHGWIDTARGRAKILICNDTGAEITSAAGNDLVSFNSNGFTVGPVQNVFLNNSGVDYASWTFRKQTKFFDVLTYTGNGSGNRTISHSLGSAPGMIICRSSTDASSWWTYHRSLATGSVVWINLTSGASSYAPTIIVGNPTSTTFDVSSSLNSSGQTYVAYLFAHDAGGFGATGTDNVISCGSYTGNGSATGPSVNIGYEAQWVMIKDATNASQWFMYDTQRGMSTTVGNPLFPNLANAESSGANCAPTATGFQILTTNGNVNASGATFIYMAIRKP